MMAYGIWNGTHEAIATHAALETHRVPGDTIYFSSAAYHAWRARTTEVNRWRPTGYATLSLVGTIVGIALLASGSIRRSA